MLSTALTAVSDRQERVHPLRESIRRSMRCDAMLRGNVRRGRTSAVMVTDALVGGLDFWSDRITWPHSGTLAGTEEGRRSTYPQGNRAIPAAPALAACLSVRGARCPTGREGRVAVLVVLRQRRSSSRSDRIGSCTDWPRKETAGLSVCSRTGYRFELCE
jgi:hypothetical protein